MDAVWVEELLVAACDPLLFVTTNQCEWYKEMWSITTPEDKAKEGEKDMMEAKWFKKDFEDWLTNADGGGRKKKAAEKQYSEPEIIYNSCFEYISMRRTYAVSNPEISIGRKIVRDFKCVLLSLFIPRWNY